MKKNELSPIELNLIRELAEEKRRQYGFLSDSPIGNDIFTILNKANITLLKHPIKSEGRRQAFSAAIMYSEDNDNTLAFIGLNTADYFDKQIFALAHELYHYYIKDGSHLSRPDDNSLSLIELKANRFAAEFLMPEQALKSILLKEFKTLSLSTLKPRTLLRFIARIHCTWWIPYRSIVRRLKEINAITPSQYKELYRIDERAIDSEYNLIATAVNRETFKKLNTPTNDNGISFNEVEIIIRNFEDGLINEDQFVSTLKLFNRSPEEFGYKIGITSNDFDELKAFFTEEEPDEDQS